MNSERKKRIEKNSVGNNLLKNLTPADIVIKEKAFTEDFKLPLSPVDPWAANIYSLVGDDLIARGYERVVTDGESIWLEIPWNWLCTKRLTKRQLTPSRQYFTLNGVTIHNQLQTELGRSPRRQKLAVKIPRAEPSSRLQESVLSTHTRSRLPLAFKVKLSGSNFVPKGWLRSFGKRLVQIITPGHMPPDNLGNLRVAKTTSGSTQQIQILGSRIDHLQRKS